MSQLPKKKLNQNGTKFTEGNGQELKIINQTKEQSPIQQEITQSHNNPLNIGLESENNKESN